MAEPKTKVVKRVTVTHTVTKKHKRVTVNSDVLEALAKKFLGAKAAKFLKELLG